MIKKVNKPKALKKGDTIGVVSPASKPGNEEKYFKGIKYLEAEGYSVKLGRHNLSIHGYLAGDDDARVADLNDMFADPEVKAIICSRGGYGVPRILHRLDYELIRKNPKIFVGYSDITALNMGLLAKAGLVTFSGPMVAVEMGQGINSYSEKSLWNSLTNTNGSIELKNPENKRLKIIKEGKAEGRLIAGCLSVFSAILGGSYVPDLEGAILVVEDVGEVPYRLDRYFAQLRLNGILDKICGLILGQFIDCVPDEDDTASLTTEEVIEDYTQDLRIPVIAQFAYGHGSVKLTLPVGVRAEMDTAEPIVRILENPVNP
ncbi:LD-carboxypeptidase [candidate division KSB1 bacterium]|nr:LD-carboxypeptidase [candidate division KSB1 bacterium]